MYVCMNVFMCKLLTLTPLLVRPVEVMSEAAKREAYPSLEQ